MRFLLVLAALALASPALAGNPDGPLGLLTVEVADSWFLAMGTDTPNELEDVGGSDFSTIVYAPVTSWLTVGTQVRYWNQEYLWDEGGSWATRQDYYWGIRARVHIPVTASARAALARD